MAIIQEEDCSGTIYWHRCDNTYTLLTPMKIPPRTAVVTEINKNDACIFIRHLCCVISRDKANKEATCFYCVVAAP